MNGRATTRGVFKAYVVFFDGIIDCGISNLAFGADTNLSYPIQMIIPILLFIAN